MLIHRIKKCRSVYRQRRFLYSKLKIKKESPKISGVHFLVAETFVPNLKRKQLQEIK
jgi:hypothetical protein